MLVGSAAVAESQQDDSWWWSITPYIWASDISEDLLVKDRITGGGDTEFRDLLDIADTTLQLHFEGQRDRWGLFGDLTYIELSDSQSGELGVLQFDVEIKEVLLEAGAIYRPGGRTGKLDLLFGARYLSVDEKYSLQLGESDPIGPVVDEGYLDALVGVRYNIPLGQRWLCSLKGDVSAGGTDYMWTAQGVVGWLFGAKRNSGVFLGYRYRDMKYTKTDVVEVKKTLSGPILGLRFGF
jgi:hypothetical protein